MASSAGQQLTAGRVPGERIATTTETSDSSTFTTTETELLSATAALVSGRTYRVRGVFNLESSTGSDEVRVRLREDDTSGTLLQSGDREVPTSSSFGYLTLMESEYTASATGDKTFVITGVRSSGSGTDKRGSSSARPAYLYVDYIEG